MIRLSVGLEDVDDLIWDLENGSAPPRASIAPRASVILTTTAQRRALLARSHTVAMVGASPNTTRPSYFVFSYLRTKGKFDVIADQSDDCRDRRRPRLSHRSPRTRPSTARPTSSTSSADPTDAPPVVEDAIAAGARAIWFQYGVVNDEAIRLADDAGLDVVVDRCIKVESARFDGGLAIGGLNTRVDYHTAAAVRGARRLAPKRPRSTLGSSTRSPDCESAPRHDASTRLARDVFAHQVRYNAPYAAFARSLGFDE